MTMTKMMMKDDDDMLQLEATMTIDDYARDQNNDQQ